MGKLLLVCSHSEKAVRRNANTDTPLLPRSLPLNGEVAVVESGGAIEFELKEGGCGEFKTGISGAKIRWIKGLIVVSCHSQKAVRDAHITLLLR